MGSSLHILDRFADVQTAARITNEWEAVNEQVCTTDFYHVYALQKLLAAQLQRALVVVDMRWHNVEAKIEEMPDYK
jgi:hypothetical protein